MDMAGKHRARKESIQIIKTCVVKKKDVRRQEIKEFNKSNLKFPKVKRLSLKRAPTKALKTLFKASRPKMF